MFKKLLIATVTLGCLGLAGFGALAWRPAIAPVVRPAAGSFAPELIVRGEALAGGGYCAACHTAKGGEKFAGGYAMETPFGAIYSTNITPDPETGIGSWSEAAFRRAMHEGVSRDGSHLLPVFSYDHFTKLSDDDVRALYAYFMTRPPVHAARQQNGIPFPFNIRYLQAGWKLLFFRPGRFEPDAEKSAEWNRGAYLALGLSHCGACHTPRNLLGAEISGNAYGGAVIDNWVAPPLTAANPAPAWTHEELYDYLRTGTSKLHGTAAGPMYPVVQGLGALPDSDIRALATYFADLDKAADRLPYVSGAVSLAMSSAVAKQGAPFDPDARLYAAACASCHYNATNAPLAARPDLALNSAVHLSDPSNLIQVILQGIGSEAGMPGVVMPAFAGAFSDTEIARIAAYLRRTRTSLPPWPDLAARIAEIRRHNSKAN
ncbi:cytochrome c (plasmid) [Bradyrhizobium sp. CB82]|uniref:cytochrome c n=1 Tax=Bradyrhizobium sp. CB82 TaxID=3039159 RepID=UPI0024B164E8|nr:cytochrome c [Bradyrhizobium sp. CB82]WFU45492.1 cytochrome c [Bradyrhizobium sp. CB82]